jgi:hypothetical protein
MGHVTAIQKELLDTSFNLTQISAILNGELDRVLENTRQSTSQNPLLRVAFG